MRKTGDGGSTALFGRALGRRLARIGMSQSELARRLDIHATTVSNWVAGSRRPSPDTVYRIEQAVEMAQGMLSKHLGYVPAPRADRKRPAPSVVDAVLSDSSLSDAAKLRLIDHYRWLLAYEGRQLELLKQAAAETTATFIQTMIRDGKIEARVAKQLMAALDQTLTGTKDARFQDDEPASPGGPP